MPAACRAPVARCTSMSATATTSMPAIRRTCATKPRPICPAPTRPTLTGCPVVDCRSRRRSRYAIRGSPSQCWTCGKRSGGARPELDDVVGPDVRHAAGRVYGAGQQVLVRHVDVEHHVPQFLEVVGGDVADGHDPEFVIADRHGFPDADRMALQSLRRLVDDAHL